jgi:hypothetical protein
MGHPDSRSETDPRFASALWTLTVVNDHSVGRVSY